MFCEISYAKATSLKLPEASALLIPILDLWALWQWMILIMYWVKLHPRFIKFSFIVHITVFIFEQ